MTRRHAFWLCALRRMVDRLLAIGWVAVTPAVIRARAQEFDTSVSRQAWRELLDRLGVDRVVFVPPP